MRNIFLLVLSGIKQNRLAIAASVISGFFLIILMNTFGNIYVDYSLSKVRIGVIDQDNSTLSASFKDYLSNDLEYELVENDYEYLSRELIDKDISVIIKIPESFQKLAVSGNTPDMQIISIDDYENAAFISAYVNSFMSSIDMLANGAGGNEDQFIKLLTGFNEKDIPVAMHKAADKDTESYRTREGFITTLGFYLMFIFAVNLFTAYMIIDDTINGIFNRIKAAPVKPSHYILGAGIFGFLLCAIELGIYGAYIMIWNADIGIPRGMFLPVTLLFSLFTVCFTISVSLVLKSKTALLAVIIGFSNIGAILGGGYFPLDMAPESLKNMAKLFPQYWFVDIFTRLRADSQANISMNIIILGLFTALTFLSGAVIYSHNNNMN